MFRSKAEKKVLELGYDPARLPPGQYLTEKWPVLHAGAVPHVDLATWDFKVWGEVEQPARALVGASSARCPTIEVTEDIHCVTRWSRFDATFSGVAWSTLAELAQPAAGARATRSRTPSRDSRRTCPLAFLDARRTPCSRRTPTASR